MKDSVSAIVSWFSKATSKSTYVDHTVGVQESRCYSRPAPMCFKALQQPSGCSCADVPHASSMTGHKRKQCRGREQYYALECHVNSGPYINRTESKLSA